MSGETKAVTFEQVVNALVETRDFCRQVGHDSCCRTSISIDAEGTVEFFTGQGALIEKQGYADECGNRAWSLPVVLGSYSDEDVGRVAQRWVNKEFIAWVRFPPVEIVYE